MSERSAARAVVLAAGSGKRMRSRVPKVLHPVGGLSLLEHSLRAAEAATSGRPILVVSELDGSVRARLQARAELVQAEPKGTAAAVAEARAALAGEVVVLVLPGDMPLLSAASLTRLIEALDASEAGAAVLTAAVTEARGYGRIVRSGDGRLTKIVEDADEPWDGAPAEVNLGAYAFSLPQLWEALAKLTSDNTQGELYLSWLPQMVAGGAVTVEATDPDEAIQVNDRVQLAQAEAALRRRTLRRLMLAGLIRRPPGSTATWRWGRTP